MNNNVFDLDDISSGGSGYVIHTSSLFTYSSFTGNVCRVNDGADISHYCLTNRKIILNS